MDSDLTAVHPGEVLFEEFLRSMGVEAFAVYRIPDIAGVLRQKSPVTDHLARQISQALGTTPEFWINLQTRYNLLRSLEQSDG